MKKNNEKIIMKNIKITNEEYEKLEAEYSNAAEMLKKASALKAKHTYKPVSDFAFVCTIARSDGIRKI